MLKILLFHGDPLLEEPLVEKRRTLQNALALKLGRNGKENLQGVGVTKEGMIAVTAFNNG